MSPDQGQAQQHCLSQASGCNATPPTDQPHAFTLVNLGVPVGRAPYLPCQSIEGSLAGGLPHYGRKLPSPTAWHCHLQPWLFTFPPSQPRVQVGVTGQQAGRKRTSGTFRHRVVQRKRSLSRCGTV